MRTPSLAAVAGFFVLAAFCLYPVWPSPTSLLLENGNLADGWGLVGRADQSMVLALVMRNADLLLSDPMALRGWGPCFPFPQSFTLGEHAFGEGILAVLPWALTGDPILSYNLVLWITFFIPGCTMFLWARYFTGSSAAGFIAGMLFQLLPARIFDGGHPFIHADYWLPLGLLALHRLFVTGLIRYAFLLAGLLILQSFASIYLLIGVFILFSVYGVFLLWTHPGYRLRALGGALSAAVVVTGFASWLLMPYLEVREQWQLLAGRDTVFSPLGSLLPGNFAFPGWIFMVLVLVGIIDRARGRILRAGEDPRMVLLVAILILIFATFSGIGIPGTSVGLPPLLSLLSGVVPGLDAVRALGIAGMVLLVPLALLAGYGARVLLSWRGGALRAVVFVSLVVGIGAFRFVPALSSASFGADVSQVQAWKARPPAADIALVRSSFQGRIAEIPVGNVRNPLSGIHEAERLLLGSYAPRPTTSCYNSFPSPYAGQMSQLLRRAPQEGALSALRALGVETLVAYPELFGPRERTRFEVAREQALARSGPGPRLSFLGATEDLQMFRLSGSPGEVTANPGVLVPGESLVLHFPDQAVVDVLFRVRNQSSQVYRDAAPAGYRDGWILWQDAEGQPGGRVPVRFLMPVALGSGEELSLVAGWPVPPAGPGLYRTFLVRADAPDRVLGQSVVEILENAAPTGQTSRDQPVRTSGHLSGTRQGPQT